MSKRRREQKQRNRLSATEYRANLGLPPLSIRGVQLESGGVTSTVVMDDGVEIAFEPTAALWGIGSGEIRRTVGAGEERTMASILIRVMGLDLSVDEYIEVAQSLVADGWVTRAGLDVPEEEG